MKKPLTIRQWIARYLRFGADRIDPDGAFRATSYGFVFVEGLGIRFIEKDALPGKPGCRIWNHGPDFNDAHRVSDDLATALRAAHPRGAPVERYPVQRRVTWQQYRSVPEG